jgi:hypothetical protein
MTVFTHTAPLDSPNFALVFDATGLLLGITEKTITGQKFSSLIPQYATFVAIPTGFNGVCQVGNTLYSGNGSATIAIGSVTTVGANLVLTGTAQIPELILGGGGIQALTTSDVSNLSAANIGIVRAGSSSTTHIAALQANVGSLTTTQIAALTTTGLSALVGGAAAAVGGFRTVEATNGYSGIASLSSGTIAVLNSAVITGDRISLDRQVLGGTPGHLSSVINSGVSITINSSSAADTSTVAWEIRRPA